jgi:hypothetical protein
MIDLESDDLEEAQNHADKALKLSQNMHQKEMQMDYWLSKTNEVLDRL